MIKSTKWIEQYWHIDNNGGEAATLWCMWASFVHSWSLGPTHSHLSVVIRAAPLIMSAGWHSTFPSSSVFSFQFHLWYWIELLGCCWLQARRQMNTQLLEPLSSKRVSFIFTFVFVHINRFICILFFLHNFNLGKTLDSSQQHSWQIWGKWLLITCEPDLVIFETERDADPWVHRRHMVTPCHNVPNQRHSLPPQLSLCPSHPS